MRIAVDAMGGDHAPVEIVKGAVAAAREAPGHEIILVGQEERMRACLDGLSLPNLRICHASEVLEMDDKPVEALRKKRDTSISRATAMVAAGEADAVVSAGNTGGAVASALLTLKPLPGIRRPGLLVRLPTAKGYAALIDVGANVEAKPAHLLHYATMGYVYARHVLGVERPSVGLLNIGEEEGKGSRSLRETFDLFRASALPFIGNIEGQEVFAGKVDVIVCEAVVGNIVIKLSEGLMESLFRMMAPHITSPTVLREIQRWDYSEAGGGHLLGVDGVVTVCHGRSLAPSLTCAIRRTLEFGNADLNRHLAEALKALESIPGKGP